MAQVRGRAAVCSLDVWPQVASRPNALLLLCHQARGPVAPPPLSKARSNLRVAHLVNDLCVTECTEGSRITWAEVAHLVSHFAALGPKVPSPLPSATSKIVGAEHSLCGAGARSAHLVQLCCI